MDEFFVYDDTNNDVSFEEIDLDSLPSELVCKLDDVIAEERKKNKDDNAMSL